MAAERMWREHELKDRYDVVIIGGGVHGLATAFYLTKLGVQDVAVLEARYIGFGGSGRNTAIVRANYRTPEGIAFYDRSVKLYEELAHGPMRPSSHEKINVAEAPAAGPAVLLDLCNHLETLAESGESEQLKELLLAAANQNWSPGETIDLTDPSEANTWT